MDARGGECLLLSGVRPVSGRAKRWVPPLPARNTPRGEGGKRSAWRQLRAASAFSASAPVSNPISMENPSPTARPA